MSAESSLYSPLPAVNASLELVGVELRIGLACLPEAHLGEPGASVKAYRAHAGSPKPWSLERGRRTGQPGLA